MAGVPSKQGYWQCSAILAVPSGGRAGALHTPTHVSLQSDHAMCTIPCTPSFPSGSPESVPRHNEPATCKQHGKQALVS